ncbi:hypothetical protein BTVI_59890 [Pitangus sulphuratus]|nr:hypothetical protein BTVI_59890 [Pitangus sulphuratus]
MRDPRAGWAWAGAEAEGPAAITGLVAVQVTQEISFSNKCLGNPAASLLSKPGGLIPRGLSKEDAMNAYISKAKAMVEKYGI